MTRKLNSSPEHRMRWAAVSSRARAARTRPSPAKPTLDYEKMTPERQAEFRAALAKSPEFKKALAEEAKDDPKLQAAIAEGMRKQAAAEKKEPKPEAEKATFSSSLGRNGWSLNGPVVTGPRDVFLAEARATSAARSAAKQAAEQKAAKEAAAASAAQVAPRAPPVPTLPASLIMANPYVARPIPANPYAARPGTNQGWADVDGSKERSRILGRNREIVAAESKTLTENEQLAIVRQTHLRFEAKQSTSPTQVQQMVAHAEAVKKWEAAIEVEFPQISQTILHRRNRFPEEVINALRSVKGVPGIHAIPLQRGRRVFTVEYNAQGKLVSTNTDTKGPGMLKKAGTALGTVLSIVPTPVQPFAAAAMAIDGADQAIKDGDGLGAVINVAAAVTVGAGYASGAASAAGNTAQAASLTTVADTAQKLGTVAQVGKAVKDKDGLALLSAAGNAAIDFNIGVDPTKATKAITAVNLIHGAQQGDIAGVLSAAANYARANGNHNSANVLRTAATMAGVANGLKDEDWGKVAYHLGMALNDVQQESLRRRLEDLEPNREDSNLPDIDPGNEPESRANGPTFIHPVLPSLGPATDEELSAVREEITDLEARRDNAQTALEQMRKNNPADPGIAGFEEAVETLENSIQLKEEQLESMAMDGIAPAPPPQDQLGHRIEPPVLTLPASESEALLKGQLELIEELTGQRDGAVDFRKSLLEGGASSRQIETIDAAIKAFNDRLQSEQRLLEEIRDRYIEARPSTLASNDLPVEEVVVRGTRPPTPNVGNVRISQRNDPQSDVRSRLVSTTPSGSSPAPVPERVPDPLVRDNIPTVLGELREARQVLERKKKALEAIMLDQVFILRDPKSSSHLKDAARMHLTRNARDLKDLYTAIDELDAAIEKEDLEAQTIRM